MKNLTLIIFLTVHYSLFTIHSFSQPCLPEGITFSTQEQIDSFQINFPGCTEIEGSVAIGAMSGTDITNLNGLSVLTSIADGLTIGDGYFLGNTLLTGLTGLENLSFVGGGFRIYHNVALTSLTGLENLHTIEGGLFIGGYETSWGNGGNPSLNNLSGLVNLSSLNGELVIAYNDNLVSLSGLENLVSIGGGLYISSNQALTSLAGLDNIISVEGHLTIGYHSNNFLTSLTGLESLTSIQGDLYIVDNDSLTSLAGLENIYAGSITNIDIRQNISLSTCEVQSICDYLIVPNGTISIDDNALGCNSQQEVEQACDEAAVNEISNISNLSIYPNPFSNTITIEFELEHPEIIIMTIYNHFGEQLGVITEGKSVGQQKIEWDCKGLPAGIYFCVLKSNPAQAGQTTKLIKL